YPGPAPAFRDHCRQTGAFRRSRRARRLPPLPCMSHISCAPDTFRSGSLPAGTVLRHRLGSTDQLTPPVNGPLITFIARAYTYRPHWLRIRKGRGTFPLSHGSHGLCVPEPRAAFLSAFFVLPSIFDRSDSPASHIITYLVFIAGCTGLPCSKNLSYHTRKIYT